MSPEGSSRFYRASLVHHSPQASSNPSLPQESRCQAVKILHIRSCKPFSLHTVSNTLPGNLLRKLRETLRHWQQRCTAGPAGASVRRGIIHKTANPRHREFASLIRAASPAERIVNKPQRVRTRFKEPRSRAVRRHLDRRIHARIVAREFAENGQAIPARFEPRVSLSVWVGVCCASQPAAARPSIVRALGTRPKPKSAASPATRRIGKS